MKFNGMIALGAMATLLGVASVNVATADSWSSSWKFGGGSFIFDKGGNKDIGSAGDNLFGGIDLDRIFDQVGRWDNNDSVVPIDGGGFSGTFEYNPVTGKFELKPTDGTPPALVPEEAEPRKVTWEDLNLKREPKKRFNRVLDQLEFDENGDVAVREITEGMSKRQKRLIRRANRWLAKWKAKQEKPVEVVGRDQVFQSWMHEDVQAAWDAGYAGQGTTIVVVDDFTSGSTFSGNFGDGSDTLHHGDWVSKNAGMIATKADLKHQGWSDYRLNLANSGLNVVNASYGVYSYWESGAQSGVSQAMVDAANQGTAVVVKAAGNNSVAVDAANINGQWDSLNLGLIGSKSGLFVGALDKNGSVDEKAALSGYSNFAGDNTLVQDRFLVVGVDSDVTGLAGTSFAAPTVSGYASILGSKFTDASAIEVSNQLLDTARTDTILNYDVAVHGQGEASLSRALAPVSIQ